MKKNRQAIIFGTGTFAEVVKFYLDVDSDYTVVGFTATDVATSTHLGLPLVDFVEVERRFPPDQFDFFVAVGYAHLNSVRQRFIEEARHKGYKLLSYICSKAIHWGGTTIGDNVFIFESNVIQPFVSVNNGTVLWSGNHVGHHSVIGAYCFISSHVVISGHCQIGSHCFLGVNATITDRTQIGDRNIIGPGALVQKNTGPDEVYVAERTKKFPKSSSKFFK